MDEITPSLTTVFTTPTSCLSRLYTVSGPYPAFVTLLEWDMFADTLETSCYPKEYQKSATGTRLVADVFSPGVCPDDHSVFAYSVSTNGETYAECCPT